MNLDAKPNEVINPTEVALAIALSTSIDLSTTPYKHTQILDMAKFDATVKLLDEVCGTISDPQLIAKYKELKKSL